MLTGFYTFNGYFSLERLRHPSLQKRTVSIAVDWAELVVVLLALINYLALITSVTDIIIPS